MDNVWDMFQFVLYLALPVVAGAVLTLLVGRIAIKLYQVGAVALEEVRERRLQTEAKGYTVDLVRPDAINGLLPVTKAAIANNPEAVLQIHLARIEAQRLPANVPHSIHYAPHYSPRQDYRNDVQALGGADVPQLVAGLAAPPADFWQLFHNDQLPGNGFLLGFGLEDNQPVIADWRKLYSALIGGQSGSGKSTLVRCILAQAALQGGKFVVIDPHQESGDESLAHSLRPLQRLMLTAPAATDSQIRDALSYVAGVARDRLAGRDTDHHPLILVVDELTGLLSRGAVADSLLDTLGLISQECRKVGVFCLAIGQNFSGAIFPTGVRNCFVSMLSCRTRRDVARVMSGSTEFAKLAEGVSIGQVVWQTPAGELHRVAVPNTTERHLTLVAKQLEANGPFVVASTPTTYEPGYQQATARLPLGLQVPAEVAENGDDGSLLVATEDDSGSQAEATPEAKAITITDAKVAHAKRLLDQHVSFPEIIQQVWGVTSSQGRKYQAARTELESIIYSLWGKA